MYNKPKKRKPAVRWAEIKEQVLINVRKNPSRSPTAFIKYVYHERRVSSDLKFRLSLVRHEYWHHTIMKVAKTLTVVYCDQQFNCFGLFTHGRVLSKIIESTQAKEPEVYAAITTLCGVRYLISETNYRGNFLFSLLSPLILRFILWEFHLFIRDSKTEVEQDS